MGIFAWRNLLTRPIRTILALVGLSIPVLGVLGLFSRLERPAEPGGRHARRHRGPDRPERQRPQPGPEQRAGLRWPTSCRKMPTVRAVAPEVWGLAPSIEGRGMIAGMFTGKQMSIFDQPVIAGQDIAVASQPPQRRLPQGPAGARRGAVPPARRRGAAEHRHQPQDRPRTSRRPGPAPQGGRHPEHQRQAVPDRRHLRDRLDAPGRRHRHGYRDGARGPQPARGVGLVHLRRGGRPEHERRRWPRRSRRPTRASTPGAWTRPRPTSAP